MATGTGITGEQTPPRKASGTARAFLRAAVLRQLWEQAAFCNRKEHDPGTGLLPLCKVQEQHGRLYHALYTGRNAKSFVLRRIFDVTAMFIDNADDFRMVVQKQRFEETEKAVKQRRKELEQAKKRIAELDRIFKRIYEDDISGAISHERFLKLSADYETE